MSTHTVPSDRIVVIDQTAAYLASAGAANLDTSTCATRADASSSAGIYAVAIPPAE